MIDLQQKRAAESPFDLSNEWAYQRWRQFKLAAYPVSVQALWVDVNDPLALTAVERERLIQRCSRYNFVFYRCALPPSDSKLAAKQIAQQMGLCNLDENLCADGDGISSIQVMHQGTPQEGYIPYTNRAINWHTDGYYNTEQTRIRAMTLHCASAAPQGGDNQIMDHEMAYILLRDKNPQFISALMHPNAMTIPPNVQQGVEIRPLQSGPVFSIEPKTGNLHMRFTARSRNVIWRDDPMTAAAVTCLLETLADARYVIQLRLSPGEGIICNNVLHNRSPFEDSSESDGKRLIYRGRYYDRVCDTDIGMVL